MFYTVFHDLATVQSFVSSGWLGWASVVGPSLFWASPFSLFKIRFFTYAFEIGLISFVKALIIKSSSGCNHSPHVSNKMECLIYSPEDGNLAKLHFHKIDKYKNIPLFILGLSSLWCLLDWSVFIWKYLSLLCSNYSLCFHVISCCFSIFHRKVKDIYQFKDSGRCLHLIRFNMYFSKANSSTQEQKLNRRDILSWKIEFTREK